MELSIVLPTHNERDNAPLLMYALKVALKGIKYEIVLVDDGSSDGTAAACQALAQIVDIPLVVLERPDKLGLGNAYKRGVDEAKGAYIAIMDADLSHDPRDLPKLLSEIKRTKATVCIGSRYCPAGGVANWPLLRRITSRGANILARIFTGLSCSDMTNSYRVYRRDFLYHSIRQVGAAGFAYQMEILYRIKGRLVELPVQFHDRAAGHSKLAAREYIHFLVRGTSILLGRFSQRLVDWLYDVRLG
ncbi:dolichol-phosphate mannosyltransferase [Nematocida homosporus]|uniref:dolichol-phosphate mannosyltransferase n=1 Tax=Nematocida homosporus TaxID=1912981 RepID=UPI002220315D|nr:dolichol-phosphate mannosyltransferase [Nematocida homosporus]KAI5186316.1 dolichol-phosphate mannosyltransferase [Nematocida homosporus]